MRERARFGPTFLCFVLTLMRASVVRMRESFGPAFFVGLSHIKFLSEWILTIPRNVKVPSLSLPYILFTFDLI